MRDGGRRFVAACIEPGIDTSGGRCSVGACFGSVIDEVPGHAPDELWILESKSRTIRRLGLP